MNENELKRMWQEESEITLSTEVIPEEKFHVDAKKINRQVYWRNLREYAAGLIVCVVSLLS